MRSVMFIKLLLYITLLITVSSGKLYSDEEDIDAVINYLLNGDSMELDMTNENEDEYEPVLVSGMWKCGNCDDIESQRLIYQEVNEVADNMMEDQSVDIQVSVAMSNMKCVTVHASSSGVVKKMAGACSGPSVTLTVLPAHHFTLQVYGD